MKVSIKIVVLTALGFGLVMSSCKKVEDYNIFATDNSIEIKTVIGGGKASGVASKATDLSGSRTAFAVGDKIGVFVVPYIADRRSGILESSGNYVNNISFAYAAGTPNEWIAATKIFYPNVESDLYGVAPFSADFVPGAKGSVYKTELATDQSTRAAIEKADFLTAKIAKQAATTSKLDMKFFHRFSKVNIKVTVPSKRLDRTVSAVNSVKLVGFGLQADVDMSSPYTNIINGSAAENPVPATVSAGSVKGNIAPHKTDDGVIGGANKFIYEAIVVPQSFEAAAGFVEVELKYSDNSTEKFYFQASVGGQTFFAGQEHVIDLSFKADSELLIGAVTILGWGDGGTTNGAVVQTVVFNDFSLKLATAQATQVAKVKLFCNDGYAKGYTLRATHIAGSKSVTFAFDGSMESPEYYPYTIKSIEFYDAAGTKLAVSDGYMKEVIDAGAEVLRPGVASANSFMVKPGASVNINVMRAGNDLADTMSYSKALVASITDVRILWQTMQGHAQSASSAVLSSVTYADGLATVTAAAGGVGGNAVVAAFDGANNILWSWHIWVSSVNESDMPHHVYGAKFTQANGVGKKIMDRNLGALSATVNESLVLTGGMHYQWGRKDPFTGAADVVAQPNTKAINVFDGTGALKSTTIGWAPSATATVPTYDAQFSVLTNVGDNIASAVKYPMTFYFTNITTNDWTNPAVNNLWTSSQLCTSPLSVNNKGVKALNDPCPAGYRVPTGGTDTYGTWGDLGVSGGNYGTYSGTGLTAGRQLTTLGGSPWYSANAYRSQEGLRNVFNAHYWTASLLGQNAYCMTFDNSSVNTNYIFRKAGMAVRCVQE